MSRTTLHVVDADGDVCDDSEYSNSWGFAAMAWMALLRRYATVIPGVDRVDPEDRYLEHKSENWTKLWKADENDALPLRPWERDTLRATYDRAIFRGADLERLADSFERFEDAHAKPGSACSFARIAKRLRELAAGVNTKIVRPDICFTATSVAADLWYVRDVDDEDDGHTYNVKRDKGHFFVDIAPGRAA